MEYEIFDSFVLSGLDLIYYILVWNLMRFQIDYSLEMNYI